MIFYFSATGNSQHVAQRIAAATSDVATSIVEWERAGNPAVRLAAGERLGFVTPVYFWGLPTVVRRFVAQLRVEAADGAPPYVFYVSTFGTSSGMVHTMMRRALAAHGLDLQGRFGVRMVDTWTPFFDLSDKEKCRRQTLAAEPRIDTVAGLVAQKVCTAWGNRPVPAFLARLEYSLYPRQRQTRRFSVTADCIGCNLCATKCPACAIEMKDNHPVWTKPECICCLGCLHRCPCFAIRYGKHTARHGQFVHPQAKL